MTNEPKASAIPIAVTAEDRHRILSSLWRRNALRAGANLPLLNVPASYHREVVKLEDRRFMAHLEPYLIRAMQGLGQANGPAMRTVNHASSPGNGSGTGNTAMFIQRLLRLGHPIFPAKR